MGCISFVEVIGMEFQLVGVKWKDTTKVLTFYEEPHNIGCGKLNM